MKNYCLILKSRAVICAYEIKVVILPAIYIVNRYEGSCLHAFNVNKKIA